MDRLFNSDFLIETDAYIETMNNTVLPWLEKRQTVAEVSSFDGRPLYCVSYQADEAVGTVLMIHGFTENAYKYAELIWSLLHLHYSVVIYDQRGHGRSWRDSGIKNLSVTHIAHFSFYVQDMECIVAKVLRNMPHPWFVFAHSMGGAVTALYLEQHPDTFKAAILSSPMIAPNTGGIPGPVASFIGTAAGWLGRADHHPFFMKPYSGSEDFSTSCATDPARFGWYDQIKAANPLFQNSVPSYRWSVEAVHVTASILAPGAPEKIKCPVLLFSAEHDSSVLYEPQKKLIDRLPRGLHVFVKGSRHEIFRSTNDVLFPWWHQVICFLKGENIGLWEEK